MRIVASSVSGIKYDTPVIFCDLRHPTLAPVSVQNVAVIAPLAVSNKLVKDNSLMMQHNGVRDIARYIT